MPVEWVAEWAWNIQPADKDWFRKLRNVTKAAGKTFFIKQLGTSHEHQERVLDGRTWDEFPEGYVKKVKGVVAKARQPAQSAAVADLLTF
jgi:protein gp37